MTDMTAARGIGRRVQAIRKARGFATARDLAAAVPGGLLSESVLQNIEAGRKNDLSVSQLLNIARALRVSPLFLLAPLGRPDSPVDLPNLSEDVASMSVAEFDNWVSGLTWGPYRARADEAAERKQLDAAREIQGILRERERLYLSKQLESYRDDEFNTTDQRIATLTKRLDELEEFLIGTDWYSGADPGSGKVALPGKDGSVLVMDQRLAEGLFGLDLSDYQEPDAKSADG